MVKPKVRALSPCSGIYPAGTPADPSIPGGVGEPIRWRIRGLTTTRALQAEAIEGEKLRAVGKRNLASAENDNRKRRLKEMKAMLAEKQAMLEVRPPQRPHPRSCGEAVCCPWGHAVVCAALCCSPVISSGSLRCVRSWRGAEAEWGVREPGQGEARAGGAHLQAVRRQQLECAVIAQ
jgi:hypothetical protein